MTHQAPVGEKGGRTRKGEGKETGDSPICESLLLADWVVGELLSCHSRTVKRMSERGEMPAPIKIASLLRWRKSEIEEWVKSGCPRCDRRAK